MAVQVGVAQRHEHMFAVTAICYPFFFGLILKIWKINTHLKLCSGSDEKRHDGCQTKLNLNNIHIKIAGEHEHNIKKM